MLLGVGRLLPDGGAGLDNEAARNRWLAVQMGALSPGIRILDAGAGELKNRSLCAHLRYVSQDFCAYSGPGDGSGLQMGTWDTSRIDLVCDICQIPEHDASFDAILCSEVFEHLTDPLRALQELTRLLKPGGKLILSAPFCALTHFAPHFYHTGFSRFWYQHHLGRLGYTEIACTANGNYFDYLAQELRRLPWAARHYSGAGIPLLPRLAIRLVLRLLARCMRTGQNSQELLCFGLHVLAKKPSLPE